MPGRGSDGPAPLLGQAQASVASPHRAWGEAAAWRRGRWCQGLSPLPALPALPPAEGCLVPLLLSLVPTSCASPAAGEQLFRSVEGQAASDEEEEDKEKWQEEQRPPAEVKMLLAHLPSCGSGYVAGDRCPVMRAQRAEEVKETFLGLSRSGSNAPLFRE